MVAFAKIRKAALARHGEAGLKARMPVVKAPATLRKVPDDRYFSQMSLRIFQAGLSHDMVAAKWPAFEEAFHGFDPRRVRAMSDEAVEDLMKDARLIRHLGKLRAVHANAASLMILAADKGGMGRYLADWPVEEITLLWADLAKRFAQMGGNSAPRFLRMVGKDTFVLTPAVVKALDHWGAFKGEPKSKADRAAVQAVFNGWAKETGLPLAHLSMTLAASVD
ncbi:MAG TPA: DNA-3-methyladenine glycosylase I [Stellaceae bacterium]|nr:DNA-3-methyladenine glycosylase I [Stellaceae bacterium]